MIPGLGRFPWSRKWQPAPVFLPGKFHGQRSLADYSPLGRKELDRTAHTHTHTQCSFQRVAARLARASLPLSVPLWRPLPARKRPPPWSGYRSALSRSCFSAVSFPLLPPLCAISKLSLPTLPSVSLEALASFPVGPPCTDHLPLNLASFPNPWQGFPGSPCTPRGGYGVPCAPPPCHLLPAPPPPRICSISGLDSIFRCLFSTLGCEFLESRSAS